MTVEELMNRLALENKNNKVLIASQDGLDLIEITKVANLNKNNITVIVTKEE